MAIPSKKSEGIEDFLSSIIGGDRREIIKKDLCTCCKKPATEFKDDLSRKEYTISGFCQTCQDDTFG